MSTPKDNDTQAITDFNEALRKVTYLEHVNAEKMNDATTDTQSTSALDNAADAAALAAGGNSLGGGRSTANEHYHSPIESIELHPWTPLEPATLTKANTNDLLRYADTQLALLEQFEHSGDKAAESLGALGNLHHALFSRRIDDAPTAARRDKFHERLHALRHQVGEAQRVAQEERESRERHAAQQAPAPAPAPQPMGGVVDAAVKAMREEWRQDVTHTNNIVNSLVIEMGQLRGRSMRLVERVAALEAAQKQASFDAQVQSARIDVWAMWAECEARKSGGAK